MVNYRINPLGISGTKYKKQMDEVMEVLKDHKKNYSGYYFGYFMWKLRKYYPVWFRGAISGQLKKNIPILYKL